MMNDIIGNGDSTLKRGRTALPYDYEVEWLGSPGSNVYLTIADKLYDFEIKFYVPQGERNVVMGFNRINGAILERLDSSNPVISIVVNGLRYNSDVTIYGEHTVSYRNGNLIIDGVYKTNIPNNQESGTIRMFGADIYNYIQNIYYLKLFEQNTVIKSLVSVVANSVGYYYDEVSGQLFGKQGSGSFVIGPRRADFTKQWSQGTGNLYATFNGEGDGTIDIWSDPNDLSQPRSMTLDVHTLDDTRHESLLVRQLSA